MWVIRLTMPRPVADGRIDCSCRASGNGRITLLIV